MIQIAKLQLVQTVHLHILTSIFPTILMTSLPKETLSFIKPMMTVMNWLSIFWSRRNKLASLWSFMLPRIRTAFGTLYSIQRIICCTLPYHRFWCRKHRSNHLSHCLNSPRRNWKSMLLYFACAKIAWIARIWCVHFCSLAFSHWAQNHHWHHHRKPATTISSLSTESTRIRCLY